jgi:transcriptional regulator with XRE-family HTH domain
MASIYKTNVIEIKKIMIEKGIDTITELSSKSGINRNTLSLVLSGDIQPSSEVMDKLVFTLDIKPDTAGNIFFGPNLRNE